MCASVRIDFDFIAAKDITGSSRGAFGHQGIGYHNGIIRALRHEIVIQGGRSRMVAVAYNFTVHSAETVSSADQAVGTMVKG